MTFEEHWNSFIIGNFGSHETAVRGFGESTLRSMKGAGEIAFQAGQSTANDKLLLTNKGLVDEVDRLMADKKQDAVDFFRWWFNQPGTNTDQGYDKWVALKGKE